MIHTLNEILRDLIESRMSRLSRLRGTTQIGFDPPNDIWRTQVSSSDEERLNIYLYDFKENLSLRSNAVEQIYRDGWYSEKKAPDRLDCHYLITAWSPIAPASSLEETPDEHALLYKVLEVLMQHRPLIPEEVYQAGILIPSGRALASVLPVALQTESLPMEVALPDGIGNIGEFWNTMDGVWKPALQLTVTLPILLPDDKEFPMVTTVIGDYRDAGTRSTPERWISIGGHVLRESGSSVQRVKGAWVQISALSPPVPPGTEATNLTQVTKEDGRFLFSRLHPGSYELRAVAPSLGAPVSKEVRVPSGTGEYDLKFT